MVGKRLIIGSAVSVLAAVVLIAAYASLSNSAIAIDPKSSPEQEVVEVVEDYEAQLQAEQEREMAVTRLVIEDERVQAVIYRSQSYHTDVLTDKDGDVVTVFAVGERDFTGDYKAGYTVTYSGLVEVKAVVRNGEIFSYDETRKQDSVTQVSYNESEQKLIEHVLSDAAVMSELAKKQGDIMVDLVTIYAEECPTDGCKRANIYVEDVRKDGLRVFVNPDTREILYVGGWQT